MKRICVYCGSSRGNRPAYAAAAERLAATFADRGIGLVYGGASVGIMGILADALLGKGGTVHGVIPQVLMRSELAHPGLTELHVVASMHERKALMAELADGFIALPGGFGTLEELFEIITWAQLGIHRKPIGLLNVDGYYDGLVAFLERAAEAGFIHCAQLRAVLVEHRPQALLERFESFQPMAVAAVLDENDL